MKYYSQQTVLEAALERIRFLFAEFPVIIVNFSGGKDSTVLLQLALQVAEEQGRLPLPVMFIDQEAEWQMVIEYMRTVMADRRVAPFWLQIPIRIFNATSPWEPWLHCWEEGHEWIRPKEETSFHANIYGTDRFHALFPAFLQQMAPRSKACFLTGVRTEESPGRLRGLTEYQTYKYITWGKVETKSLQHYAFHPLYDWSYTDIWKAIHAHGWSYCPLYDSMYQYGIQTVHMRVSNIHHETAVRSLFYLQELEPETWNRVTRRLGGLNTVRQLQQAWLSIPKILPAMFATWQEYRDYLLEHLITDPGLRKKFAQQFQSYDTRYVDAVQSDLVKMQLSMLFTNDYHGTKLTNFRAGHGHSTKKYQREHAHAS